MLDPETILVTTEDVLCRHGPAKASVVDVARVLGVSHAAVYRYFPSKTALREAVTRRWLTRAHDELTRIACGTTPAPERLRTWLGALFAEKRTAATHDPELFATYGVLAGEHSAVAADHVADLLAQLATIVADGVAEGAFASADPAVAARAVFEATIAFHHPAHAAEWGTSGMDERFGEVCDLLLAGLTAGSGERLGGGLPSAP